MTKALIDLVIPVRWRDLDAYNHVNNSTFLTYIEEARIAWFGTLGEAWRTPQAEPLVAAIQVNFKAPIIHPESLRVILRVAKIGNASLTIDHQICSQNSEQKIYSDGHTVLVWVDPSVGRPTSLPMAVRNAASNSTA
jgi:acyl-CoA thioester hydrolase